MQYQWNQGFSQSFPPPSDPDVPGPQEFLLAFSNLQEEAETRPGRGRRKAAALLAGLAGLSAAGALLFSTCTFCYAVTQQGKPLAYIGGQDCYRQAVAQVEEDVSQILDQPYAYPQTARVTLAIAPREKIQTSQALADRLMETVDQVKEEYVLTVDGVPVGACHSSQEIAQALSQIKGQYTTQNTVATYFENEVAVSQAYLPAQAEVMTAGELARELEPTRQAPEETPPAEPPAAEAFAPAEASPAPPALDVCTVEEVTYTRSIPSPVEEVEDPSLLLGQRRVIQQGTDGTEEKTDRVVLRCGQEESRETISTTVVTEPTVTRVAVGTAQGVEGARGRFIWPCVGRITSPFGPRTIFGSQGFHSGTDIANPQGTPIVAAAEGTVVWAGPKGSYGNLVKVDHGNGFLTYYSHCSQLLVTEGETVSQGQTIALVGSTGRSTGPHCHFELRWQQEPLDPQLCLP
ncbi:MAG: peptidoglycan DD-metalloendopeptidase family protein [Evtepia sp.]|uniref:M23 family metallopeptidase n=1 Tax=Evtepia sp. TaxID=2773933 RepID=UPI002A75DA4E|nr:peptidoglycan DD-metalloendopeptidase family protein [Evtepia sp.]MDY3014921.1 peptidoglycan DD-metalloendopeptidase family protein [Evtepia sp.]